jgi:hypothetical protein
LWVLAACGAEPDPTDAGTIRVDSGMREADSGADGGIRTDAGIDAGVGTDAGMDADAGTDAGMDAGRDAGTDAGMDAGRDAGADAGMDAGRDAGRDAGMDAGCVRAAGAAVGAACCPELGASACVPRASCAALDGAPVPTCHLAHSREGGESCTDDAQCRSEDCASGTCAAPLCIKRVVVMGFWPPTNEMLRPWSTNPAQNTRGWIGENWEGYGYDVYSFFPEFPPDGDPTNNAIGTAGSVGSPLYDLQVDYQETSADFWRIVDANDPVILLTTSRGSSGWEIEAVEGGHGVGSTMGPERDWISDGYMTHFYPSMSTIDARSWTAISTYRRGTRLPTQQPVAEIMAATSALGLTTVYVDATGTSGNYLSGFLGLHGLYYNSIAPHNAAAGHIHVGGEVSVANATALVQASMRAILTAHPVSSTSCP